MNTRAGIYEADEFAPGRPSAAAAAHAAAEARRHQVLMVLRVLVGLVFLGFWEFASDRLIDAFFISSPVAVGDRLWQWITDGTLLYHLSFTLTATGLGFVIGSFIGFAIGFALGRSNDLATIFDPYITAIYCLPKIALAPLFVLSIGIGMWMKIVLTATVVFFLVFLNTFTGVRSVSRELVTIVRLMGANERHVLGKIVLPSAITWVFAGLRISVPYALIGAIVGELIASNRGLGFVLASASGQFDTAGVFAALIAIMLLAFTLNALVRAAETWFMPWKVSEAAREVTI